MQLIYVQAFIYTEKLNSTRVLSVSMDTETDTRKMDQKVKKMKKDKKYLWTMAESGIMHKGAGRISKYEN